MSKKYVLNLGTKKYHMIDMCCHSKNYRKDDPNFKEYEKEDEIVREYQNYVSKCKICFKNKQEDEVKWKEKK